MNSLGNNSQHALNDIDLLLQSNDTFVSFGNGIVSPPNYKAAPSNISPHEVQFIPLISPATTPLAFQDKLNNNHNINSSEIDFPPLTLPAIDDYTNQMTATSQDFSKNIYQQYDELEQERLLIAHRLSEMEKSQLYPIPNDFGTSNNVSIYEPPTIHPVTPGSLMNIKIHPQKNIPPSENQTLDPFNNGSFLKSKHGGCGGIQTRRHLIQKPKKQDTKIVPPRPLKPLLISPTLTPDFKPSKNYEELIRSTKDAEHILTTRSNYQNLMEGKGDELGIAFTTEIKSGLEVRKTAHKVAEQKRRDILKEWFDKLRYEVENGYVKKQKTLLAQIIRAQNLENDSDDDDDDVESNQDINNTTMKPLSKVALLEYTYEYIFSLKNEIDAKDKTIDHLLSNNNTSTLNLKRKRCSE